jgi:homogentisate 1,2-dioxygenase
MAHYQRIGTIPPKRHTQHRDPEGALYHEELMGEEGFTSDSSLLYHRHLPSAIVDARTWDLPDQATTPNHPLRPMHLRLHELFPGMEWKAADAVTGRRLVLGNADVRISYAAVGQSSPLYRNATGDECVYVEAGTGVVETVFGDLEVGGGDYVILPRATTHRWVPTGEEALRL